jgi:hypothetical protein
MTTTTDTARLGGIRHSLRRAEGWLDARGTWAWITLLVLSFIFVWPVGLALLAYMIWGKQMFARSCGSRRALSHDHDRAWGRHAHRAGQATGNRAFDSYKAEALRRLEEEQDAFEAFLQRLRTSKDKSEFDAFMEDRARAMAAEDAAQTDTDAATEVKSAPKAAKTDRDSRPGEY